jgi:hypothetical protein
MEKTKDALANDLHFSANGLGVVLRTKHGGLRFTTEEFGYYQNLFTIADCFNQGKLHILSSQLNALLVRTDVPWAGIEKAVQVISKYRTEGDESDIFFYQWLMLCKLIAFYQETKRTANDKVFKNLHTSKIIIPYANFNFNHAQKSFLVGTYYEVFKVTLAEWMFSGDDFQNQHVKFIIETTATLFNDSEVPKGSESSSKGNEQPPVEKYSVERRYSEFEAFALILQKNYKSVVVPPLPLKNWGFLSLSDSVANQRAREFQMFLNDLTTHPVLKYSYELKSFLQSSTQGYKSFVELYTHVNDGKLNYGKEPAAVQLNEVVTKMLSDGAVAVTSGASMLFNSMWDTVKKNIPKQFVSPTQSRAASSEGQAVFDKTAAFLESIHNLGRKLESLVSLEQNYQTEIAKIAQCCKNVSAALFVCCYIFSLLALSKKR